MFTFVTPGGALGYTTEQLIDRHPTTFMPRSMPAGAALPFFAKERVNQVDVWFRRADGATALLVTSAVPIRDADGPWVGARGVCRDVTDECELVARLAAEQMLKHHKGDIARTLQNEIEPDKMLVAAAAATTKALSGVHGRIHRADGYDRFMLAAEFGVPPVDNALGDGLEAALLARMSESKDSEIMALQADRYLLCVAAVYRQQQKGVITVTRRPEAGPWTPDDVALAHEAALHIAIAIVEIENHDQLLRLSRTDEMTKLLNRRAFFEELKARVEGDRPAPGAGALFFVDLDNFKLVNDVHGHLRGDEALIEVASILTANSRPGELVARFGGDQFALWLDRTDEDAAAVRAREILDAARRLREFSGDTARPLGMSIGIAT